MIDSIKSRLKELEKKRLGLKPKIEHLEAERLEKIAEVNKKYDHVVGDISAEVEIFESKIRNDFIDLFSKVIMEEFDAKRSTSDYMVTDKLKQFRDEASDIEIFPNELIERLDKVIAGSPIENIAYDLEKIKHNYKKHT
jgi:hypothetical protein